MSMKLESAYQKELHTEEVKTMPTISMFFGLIIRMYFAPSGHQEELMADWKLVMNGEDPFKINPLQ